MTDIPSFSDRRRILLLVDRSLNFVRGLLRGVRAYAIGKPEWILRDAAPQVRLLKAVEEWRPDGVIAGVVTPGLAQALRRLGVPVVDTANVLPRLRMPIVDVDPEAIGKLAAEYLLERQFRNFAFFGSRVAVYSQAQKNAFARRVREAKAKVYTCYYEYLPDYAPGMVWRQVTTRIWRWLRGLPKPVAIYCCEDVLSRLLADTCAQLGFRIPEDVALLGCGNDELECTLSEPSLSSIVVPAEKVGYEAAALLDRLMAGEPAPPHGIFLPPVGVVTRHSTDTLGIEDELLRQAVRFIREHALEEIRVSDIVQALAVGRRSLERQFRRVLGRTILQEIYRVRVEHAKRLLVQTHWPIGVIALRSGFSCPRHLDVRFRQFTGMTPRAYRRQFRPR